MFTVNHVKTSVLCLAREISVGAVTKIIPIYQRPACSTALASLLVADEVQTLGQLCTMQLYNHQLRAAKLAILTSSTEIQNSLHLGLNHPRHFHPWRCLRYTDVAGRRIEPLVVLYMYSCVERGNPPKQGPIARNSQSGHVALCVCVHVCTWVCKRQRER